MDPLLASLIAVLTLSGIYNPIGVALFFFFLLKS